MCIRDRGELDKRADERTKRHESWPSNARALSNALRRLTHNLRATGINVEFGREQDKGRRRIITITNVDGIYRPPASNRPTEGMPDTNPNLTADGKPNHEDTNDDGSVHISVRNSVSEKGSSDAADDTDARILGLSKDVLEVE